MKSTFTYDIHENVRIIISALTKNEADWKFLHYYVPLYASDNKFKFNMDM